MQRYEFVSFLEKGIIKVRGLVYDNPIMMYNGKPDYDRGTVKIWPVKRLSYSTEDCGMKIISISQVEGF